MPTVSAGSRKCASRYAEAFAGAGYHALVFDYRHFGKSEGEPRLILDIKKQQQDWRAAIRFAKGLPGVYSHRIALWGTSFSGGHVLEIAATDQDPDIAAIISQAPHLNGFATAAATGFLQNIRLGTAAWRDIANMILRRNPYYVPSAGRPGDLAAMTAPDVVEGVKRLYPRGSHRTNGLPPYFPFCAFLFSGTAGKTPRRPLAGAGCSQ